MRVGSKLPREAGTKSDPSRAVVCVVSNLPGESGAKLVPSCAGVCIGSEPGGSESLASTGALETEVCGKWLSQGNVATESKTKEFAATR